MARRTRSATPAASRQPEPPAWSVRAMNAAASALYLLAALLYGGLLLAWLVHRPQFDLAAIEVRGDVGRNSAITIRANVAPHLAGNLFSVDLARARAAFEAVPWVRHAVVQRVWPNRLAVTLEEHRAAAFWHVEEGQDKLVNEQGEVFEANPGDVEDEGLPMLQGPEGSSAALLSLDRRLGPALAPLDATVEQLSMSARGSWRAGLDSGAEIELGRGSEDEVLARASRFAATVPQLEARYGRPLRYADLRHADAYALKLEGIGTTEAPARKPTTTRGH